jgi:hypothetical protein
MSAWDVAMAWLVWNVAMPLAFVVVLLLLFVVGGAIYCYWPRKPDPRACNCGRPKGAYCTPHAPNCAYYTGKP